MSELSVLITDGLAAEGLEILAGTTRADNRAGISAEELLEVIGEYDALIVRGRTKVTAQVFEAAKKLKVVGRAGVGVDNIDLEAARAHGVTVVNSPTATSIAVAELAFALLLSVARDVPRADAGMKQGNWLKKELKGVELYGKTLGVIGYGRIGSEIGNRAKAFGMTVVAADPFLSEAEIRTRGAEPLALDDLLAQADYISLNLPLTDQSRNLLAAGQFAKMKDGVRLVTAARGGIIDEAALLQALNSGKVAAAGLDVFAAEPPGATDLVKHPKVVATPHTGAQTAEAQVRAAIDIAGEICAALKGEALRWKVA